METKPLFVVPEADAVRQLKRYQIPYPDHGVARSAAEAAKTADALGYPVVLKVLSPDISHKSDAGGVIIGLHDAKQVRRAYDDVTKRVNESVPGADISGVMVCRQAQEGLEVIVGGIDDTVFGPTVMFGLGGIFTEVFRDVAFRIAPLERIDAEEMVHDIKGYHLLEGQRGQGPRDVESLIELLMSVSRLMTEESNIKELDLNPVRLYERGLLALDARIIMKAET
jgi:acyl-CoA synthetase (NDP forming)